MGAGHALQDRPGITAALVLDLAGHTARSATGGMPGSVRRVGRLSPPM
jgi:hypothetical protein